MDKELTENSQGDQYYTLGQNHYCLRVEQVDKDMWWWACISNNLELDSGFEETKKAAKKSALRAYKFHNPNHELKST